DAQARIVELLEADARRVEAHQRVLAHELEEGAALVLALAVPGAVGEVLEEVRLPGTVELAKGRAVELAGVGIEPGQAVAEPVLDGGVARDHEVDELAGAGLAGSGAAVARDDQLGEALDGRVLPRREEPRRIARRLRRDGGAGA